MAGDMAAEAEAEWLVAPAAVRVVILAVEGPVEGIQVEVTVVGAADTEVAAMAAATEVTARQVGAPQARS
jgi:hypothetical protein